MCNIDPQDKATILQLRGTLCRLKLNAVWDVREGRNILNLFSLKK